MGDQQHISPQETRNPTAVTADQVIFTSMRSAVGEGYRIIAASAGVCSEERMEITKRSPSHGSLRRDDPSTVGLAKWTLDTDRHCIAYSRYGGMEQTARGGQRVYTRLIILDGKAYENFHCDVTAVYAAILNAVGDDHSVLDEGSQLGRLTLGRADRSKACAKRDTPQDHQEMISQMLPVLAGGDRMIVVGAERPIELLASVLAEMPVSQRTQLSVTVGMKFSSSRPVQLVFVDCEDAETKRLTMGRDYQWFSVKSPTGAAPCPCHT